MSFGMGLTATLAVKAEEKAIAKLSVSSTMLATTFLRASCEAQAMMVQKLVAEGRIRDMCDAGDGEYADVVDAADADYDSDVDFVDDDEIAEEICSFDARAASSEKIMALSSKMSGSSTATASRSACASTSWRTSATPCAWDGRSAATSRRVLLPDASEQSK